MNITIFTPAGRTFTFKEINMMADNETILQFGYLAMSDGKEKLGTFLKSNIVGWSTYD